MKPTRLVLGLWIGLVSATSAQAAPSQHEQLAAETLELSGAKAIFNSIQISAGPSEGKSYQGPGEEKIIAVMNEPLDVEMGRKMQASSISKNLDDQILKVLLKWYRSPLWLKIKAQKADAPEDPLHISRLQYLYELKTRPPTPKRVELLKKLAKENKSIEMMYEVIGRTAINLARITSPESSSEKVEDSLSKNKSEQIEASKEQYVIRSLYDYRAITDEELEQFIEFKETEEYLKFEVIIFSSVQVWLNETLVKKTAETVEQLRRSDYKKGTTL